MCLLHGRVGKAAVLTICGYAASINVRKLLWACAEMAMDYRLEAWGSATMPTSAPAFRALTPFGRVPVLIDGDACIAESNRILSYLAERTGRIDLVGDTPLTRAKIGMWLDWQICDFNNSWRPAFMGLVRGDPNFQDADQIARSMGEFARHVAMIEAVLAKGDDYICGDDFTLADIAIGLSIHRWQAMPGEKPAFAAVDAYYRRLGARAGFQRFGVEGGP